MPERRVPAPVAFPMSVEELSGCLLSSLTSQSQSVSDYKDTRKLHAAKYCTEVVGEM